MRCSNFSSGFDEEDPNAWLCRSHKKFGLSYFDEIERRNRRIRLEENIGKEVNGFLITGVIRQSGGNPRYKVVCQDCGNESTHVAVRLKQKKCFICENLAYIGNRYGRLTITKYAGIIDLESHFFCDCDCGATDVLTTLYRMKIGKTKSCGCVKENNRIHKKRSQA